MYMAIPHLRNMVKDVTPITLENVEIWPDLPVDLSPGDAVGLSDESHELLQVPSSIDDMLCSYLAVIVDIGLGFAAVEHLALTHGK